MFVFHIVVTIALVVVFATALAHALEMPGKARLPRETYLAVQRVYYPGFTVVGWAEPLVVVGSVVSAVLTTNGGDPGSLRWAVVAIAVLAHGAYWFVVHPTNRQWSARTWIPPRPPSSPSAQRKAAGWASVDAGNAVT